MYILYTTQERPCLILLVATEKKTLAVLKRVELSSQIKDQNRKSELQANLMR